MSELQDWKLKAQTVVKLCNKKCDKSVSLLVLRLCKMRPLPQYTCVGRNLPQYSPKTAAKSPKTNDLRVSRHILPVQCAATLLWILFVFVVHRGGLWYG